MKIEVTQCSMCTHYNTEQYCEVWEQYITNDTFYCACGVKADRKTEPQTETEIAKAIVHKMIDDAVIAEDAYPDLRQKMHDAVDEYESQTERSE